MWVAAVVRGDNISDTHQHGV